MYNRYLSKEQLAVKVGDHVIVDGFRGIVEKVFTGVEKEWNGEKYVDKTGTEYTDIKVVFSGELSKWGQYNHGVYSSWHIENDIAKWEKYL